VVKIYIALEEWARRFELINALGSTSVPHRRHDAKRMAWARHLDDSSD
jgi:hypothetical protein